MTSLIHVSAVVLRDAEGRVLMVRKRGTGMWMNPGGKPEAGEDGAACGAREVAEELGLILDPARLEFMGKHRAAAANEPDHVVVSQSYLWPEAVDPDVHPAAEIEAVRWVDPTRLDDASLAPLFVEAIAPLLDRP
ncbi:NUDIX hydrolase [Tessaracoccus flavescens]|uniref:Nudix hydrolase domain-containing protein n=1 Tax=Tessaracoccus flavescens TaxID=399497 RepID=A0A1Q2CZG3_9ACTN|nr:NUDIX domain-containing protein [Tessaracoccus flavescens]AQP51530.1 hypothetical protein BW733_12630 [Tessaracoccus flavescens]